MATPEGQDTAWAQMQVLFGFEITEYKQQSLELLPQLLKHMALAGVEGKHCKGIACNIGPGGFTSLRTACGVAQGLATAWSCGVLAATSFECMAAEYVLQGGRRDQPLACYVDARLQEFYAAGLSLSSSPSTPLSLVTQRSACQISANIQAVRSFSQTVSEASEFPSAKSLHLIDPSAFRILEDSGADLSDVDFQLLNPGAHGLAVMGVSSALLGELKDPYTLQPLYVREKVAQTTSERMAARNVGI